MAPISPLMSSDELFGVSPSDESDESDDSDESEESDVPEARSNPGDALVEGVVAEGTARPAASDKDGPGVKSARDARDARSDAPAASTNDDHGGSSRRHGAIRRMPSSHSLRRRALSSPFIRVSGNNAGGASQQRRGGGGGYVVRSMSGHMPGVSGTLKISPDADDLIFGGRRTGHSRSQSDPQGTRKPRQDESTGHILRLLRRSASACGRLERSVRKVLLSPGKRQCKMLLDEPVVTRRPVELQEVVLPPAATDAADDVVAVGTSASNANGASASSCPVPGSSFRASTSPRAPAVAPARTDTDPGKMPCAKLKWRNRLCC